MLLTISTTHYPATDLGYLLHKHPDKLQQVEISGGVAHIFYTEVSDHKTTAALLLDIDPIGLVRKNTGSAGNEFALRQYVNDRPYVASSFLSAAIAKAFSSAMNGRCKDKPELVDKMLPFEVKIAVLPVKGGEPMLRKLFEPLGYTIDVERHLLDEKFPQWGESWYFTVTLKNLVTLQQLLTHLYVLIPVCDNDKHYWVSHHEIEKLLEKGKGWLENHPEQGLIINRYLKHQQSLANIALTQLLKDEAGSEEDEPIDDGGEPAVQKAIRMHDVRLQVVKEELIASHAKRVVDLGCGEGKLLKQLLESRQFEQILGMDISFRALTIAKERLRLEKLSSHQQQQIQLVQGSLTYKDKRLEGFDAATLVEVIEHLDQPRLASLERVVFEFAKPALVIVTTPNADYNVKFQDMAEGSMRHPDHRFEWSRAAFESWAKDIAERFNYEVIFKNIGDADPELGAITQMALFRKNN